MTRIDYEDCDRHCFRGDHRQANVINAARIRAHEKHGTNSVESIDHDDPRWLAILVEEVGEVAHALTYDADPTRLADELVDVLTVASAWLDAHRAIGLVSYGWSSLNHTASQSTDQGRP